MKRFIGIALALAVGFLALGGIIGIFIGNQRGFSNGMAAGIKEGHKSGYEAGLSDGKRQAQSDIYERGRKEGYEAGYADALKKGHEENVIVSNVIAKETVYLQAEQGLYECFSVPEDSVGIEITASVKGNNLQFFVVNEQNWDFMQDGKTWEPLFGSKALDAKTYSFYDKLVPGRTYYFYIQDYEHKWFSSYEKQSSITYTITSESQTKKYVEYMPKPGQSE